MSKKVMTLGILALSALSGINSRALTPLPTAKAGSENIDLTDTTPAPADYSIADLSEVQRNRVIYCLPFEYKDKINDQIDYECRDALMSYVIYTKKPENAATFCTEAREVEDRWYSHFDQVRKTKHNFFNLDLLNQVEVMRHECVDRITIERPDFKLKLEMCRSDVNLYYDYLILIDPVAKNCYMESIR